MNNTAVQTAAGQIPGAVVTNMGQDIEELQYEPVESNGSELTAAYNRINELEALLQDEMIKRGGEAPGLAWVKLYTPQGAEITVSERAASGKEAVRLLIETIRFAHSQHLTTTRQQPQMQQPQGQPQGVTPQPQPMNTPQPQVNAPQPTPAASGGGVEEVTIRTIMVDLNKAGEQCLKIKGGRYTQHGIVCYKELIPPVILNNIAAYQMRVDYGLPVGCGFTIALYDPEKKKVVGFK